MVRLLPPERDISVLRAPVRSTLGLVGIFLVVLLAVALLERIGVETGFAPFAIVSAAFALFVLAALYAHSRRAVDFYVADRKVTGAFGGLAGAGGLAGLLTIGLAGGAYDSTASFLVSAFGLAVGYLVLGFAIAPGLRAFGAYTSGDFIAARFGGILPRLIWAGITFSVSFLLFVAHLKIAAPLAATLLGIHPQRALYLCAGLTAMAALPGGMRSLTWTQAIQYFVIALACIVPAGFFASGEPVSQSVIAQQFSALLVESLPAWRDGGAAGVMLPMLMAVLGAASLPHLSARSLAAPSGREAAVSMIWAVLFSFLLVLAGLVLFDLLAEVVGPSNAQESVGGPVQIAALFAALPSVLAGLLLAGTLAALFALGQAALFSAATALSHDVWDEILDRRGPEGRRIMIARVILVGVAAGAVTLVPFWQADAAPLVGWALALAGAGSFAPLALGLWWRRCNEIGAVGGMVAGFGFTALVFLLGQNVIPEAVVTTGWADVGPPTAALAGLLMSVAATVGLSLVTPAPESETQKRGERAAEERRGRLPIRERPA